MSSTAIVNPVTTAQRQVGLFDVPLALFSPKRVFARVEDVPVYGWALIALLMAVTLIGYAEVETGLIDLEVDRQVERGIAELEKEQYDVVERSALTKMIQEQRKAGEFLHLMDRIRVVVVNPVAALATILVLASLFYALVALSGRKPEWHTLLTVCIFASFVDVVAGAVRLGFMLRFETLTVNTSLAALAPMFAPEGEGAAQQAAALSGILSMTDPFRIWFWVVLGVGLAVTAQLRGWKVWTSCILFWLVAAGVRTAALLASTGVGASA